MFIPSSTCQLMIKKCFPFSDISSFGYYFTKPDVRQTNVQLCLPAAYKFLLGQFFCYMNERGR